VLAQKITTHTNAKFGPGYCKIELDCRFITAWSDVSHFLLQGNPMTFPFLRMASLLPLLLALPAAADPAAPSDIADLSIEELANIQITSVSRKPEALARAAASVFVITADDIRRSGYSSIAEVLRLAPNLQVANGTSGAYAISARGMNGSGSSAPNKLQVLVDGRSVYAPLFSGVFWDVQNLMLEDVDRIEVISGPGGTLWGANAVNGVINITTRAARETTGSLAVLAAGEDGHDAAFRQGGAMDGGHWRVFGKYLDLRHTVLAGGGAVDDARHQAQVGMRADWERGPNQFSVNANAYRGKGQQAKPGSLQTGAQVVLGDIPTSGVNLAGRWTHQLAAGGNLSVQGSLERTERSVPPMFSESLDIADLQLQHGLAQAGAHSVVWGVNYRNTRDRVTNSTYIAFLPAHTSQTWASLYAQDEITLGGTLRLVAGARMERNPYTGSEFLPTLRLAWTPAPAHTVWASASRTVRAPSRLDADAFIPGQPPFLLRGGPAIRSEVAKVVELGYRGQPTAKLSYSITAFHNWYDDLRTQEVDPGRTFITFANLMEGKASGIEMWGNYQATPAWRLSAGLMALHEKLQLKAGSNDAAGVLGVSGKDPSHTAQLRSTFNLSDNVDVDVGVRKVGPLPKPYVRGYAALDARVGWRPRKGMELSVVARNLNGGHGEYGSELTRSEWGRSLGVKLVWQQ
jgi:iron complex outermembrane receptor protein